MSIDNVVQLNITRDAPAVSRAGFGIMLILGPNASGWSTDRIRFYTSADAMLTDGFSSGNPEYKAAAKAFSQKIKPVKVAVGKQAAAVAQVRTIDLQGAAANSATYTVTINDTDFDYDSDSDATEAEILGGLLSLINAGAEPVTASGGMTSLVLTADEAGVPFDVEVSANLTSTATTANHGVAEDLAEIKAINNDWYGIAITSRDDDVIQLAAAWTEANRKLFLGCTDAAGVIGSGNTDVASLLKAAAYDRTAILYSGDQANMPEAGLLGRLLPQQPGSYTAALKTIAGVTVDDLSETAITNALGKYANVYTPVGGINITRDGKVASGEYLDVIVGIDWIHANMQADVFQVLVNNEKVPFTDRGIGLGENAVRGRLRLAYLAGIINDDYVVTVPKASEVSSDDKANRALTGISFSATLQGAIHKTTINGTVSI